MVSLLSVMLLPLVCHAKEQKHNVNCNKEFEFSQTQVKLSVSYLQKISGSLDLTPDVLAQVDKWTTISLDNQRALCDAYSKSTETNFPTNEYLTQLQDLRAWQLDFLKIVITAQNVDDKKAAAAAGGRGPNDPEVAQLKTDLSDQIKSLLNNPAKAVVPPTAAAKP